MEELTTRGPNDVRHSVESARLGGAVGIKVTGKLSAATFGSSLVADGANNVTIDLAGMSFCEPGGLVGLAALVEGACRASRSMTFNPPQSPDCQRYLSRMGLRDFLMLYYGAAASAWLPEVNKHEAPSLSELRRFEGVEDLEHVVTRLVGLYREAGGTTVEPLYESLSETAANAVEHSGVGGGWVALQSYQALDEFSVATADCGVGLRATLRAATDGQAIALAARRHETSTGEPGRGRGISSVIDLTADYGGRVTYVTGNARGSFTKGNWDPRLSSLSVPFRGTLAEIRMGRRRQ